MRKPFKRLTNSEISWVGGICAGIAYKLEVEVWLVRLIVFLIFLASGVIGWIYILIWIFAPHTEEVPEDYKEVCIK